MQSFDYKHTVGHSLLTLSGEELIGIASFKLVYEANEVEIPNESENTSECLLGLPHRFLESVVDLTRLKLVCLKGNSQIDLREIPAFADLWACFDVDTPEVFWRRVASTSRPIREEGLLRLVCKRASVIHNNFSILGAAACALGYRILDSDNAEDPDTGWLIDTAGRVLSWEQLESPYDDARWSTSVLILMAYWNLNFRRWADSVKCLQRLLHYRSAIKYAALIQTNLVRASLLLADYEMSMGNYARASEYLTEVPLIAKDGIWWSDLSDPVSGAFKYTEFDVVLSGSREAQRLVSRMSEISEKKQVKLLKLQDLGGYVGVLFRRGRLDYGQ